MPLTLRRTTPDDRAELVRFLAGAFGACDDAPFLEPRLMHWKYWAPRPGWEGLRSYVMEQDGRIVAHGCVYPTSIAGAIRVIDWAGSAAAPGSGVLLMRKLAAMAGAVLAPGGSEDTRAVLPKIGFREAGRMWKYARVVRPWRHLALNPRRDWRTLARFARNLVQGGLPPAPADWTAERVERFGDERLDYMLACPGAEFSGYVLRKSGVECGWFLLAQVLGQARIAALETRTERDAAWRVAVRTAAADPRTAEVMTAVSHPLTGAGLRPRGFDPVLVYGKLDKLALSLWDGDECFLANPEDPFT